MYKLFSHTPPHTPTLLSCVYKTLSLILYMGLQDPQATNSTLNNLNSKGTAKHLQVISPATRVQHSRPEHPVISRRDPLPRRARVQPPVEEGCQLVKLRRRGKRPSLEPEVALATQMHQAVISTFFCSFNFSFFVCFFFY